eukprot:TRINITY_DN7494_c0_g1_i1.p1 TRINITY_DN7494_c0_g1~~TRINITY_DN7494_c0_g1_i1.p1  ORF type:complete len:117 (-),score=21.30 TRINITY_DN7494_c0_g1_i1:58-408(-)
MPYDSAVAYIKRFLDDYSNSEQLLANYVIKPYDGRVAMFTGTDEGGAALSEDGCAGWRTYCSNITTHLVSGNHDNIVFPPHIEKVASILSTLLLEAPEGFEQQGVKFTESWVEKKK